jgi:signal transduction histidine kinase
MFVGWRRNALVAGSLFAVFCGASIAFGWASIRRRRDRRQARRRTVMLQKLRTLGQMAGSMAHDFNNVLAVVEAGLRLIDRNAEEPAKVRALSQETREATARAGKLISQLQDFARGQELDLRAYDVAELLRRLEPVLRRAAGPSVELSFDIGRDPLLCAVDRTQFDSALLNLVINARDAMPKGGEIRISARPVAGKATADRWVRVLVADDGQGMPAHVRRRIFEPFFTTKAKEGGTGLGLAQVYGFMQQIGGDLRVRSRPGKGAEFELLLPFREAGATARLAAAAPLETTAE